MSFLGGTAGSGGLKYKGFWDANTNSPSLVSSTGTKDDYYVVNVLGATNLDGETDWDIGDWVVFNGTVWQKLDNSEGPSKLTNWTPLFVYKVNTMVWHEKRIYRALIAHTSLATFSPDRAKWEVVKPLELADFIPGIHYYIGEEVFDKGRVLTRLTDGNSLGTIDLDRGFWDLRVRRPVDDFAPGDFYYATEDIFQSGNIYTRIANGTAGAVFNLTEAALWTRKIDMHLLDWAPNTLYKKYNIVWVEGRVQRAKNDHTSDALLFNNDRVQWEPITKLPRANYLNNTYYYTGEDVDYGDVILTKQIDGMSPPTFTMVDFPLWKLTGQGLISAYVPGWFYFAKTKIIDNNIIYDRRLSGQAGVLFNTGEIIAWDVLGTKDTPVSDPGQTKTLDYVVQATDGTIILTPSASQNIIFPLSLPDNKTFFFKGNVDITKPTTFVAGAGALIVNPATFTPGVSFTNIGWTNNANFYFGVRRVGNTFNILQ